ncbi:MAG: glycoside hydrolase family 13 protein [Clostridiales bacterium]|nr:glycoside hydrolase family 13 protein [Clostridiales bacterium]
MNNINQRLYSLTKKDYLIHDAIFSDCTRNFVSNPQPKGGELIEIKIRAAKDNTQSVNLHIGEKVHHMQKFKTDTMFDYFKAQIKIDAEISYYFCITHESGTSCFYNNQGAVRSVNPAFNFRVIPDFAVPDWAFGAVIYQIYVDRFYNGDSKNNVVNNEYAYLSRAAKHIEKWDEPLENADFCNFYGGDLKGVCDKLDYIKSIGVDCIYFSPIFVSPSNHKYDIQDYDYVDPHYGKIVNDGGEALVFEKFHNRYATKYVQRTTDKENLEASNDVFINLVNEAHKRGIKVILDGVFNHCGCFNKWLDKQNFYGSKGYPNGAYRDVNSKYHDYFKWYDDNWPNNDCYVSWWGNDNHPKLNYEGSRELFSYILSVARKWVSPPFNADGWRLDVAADLGFSPEFNHKFWQQFRKEVKDANPNAIILAEHYGEATDWLKGDQWDTVMNYDAFMDPVTWFLTGMEKHSESYREDLLCNAMAFEGAMRYHMSRFTYQSLYISMNELSNHDHSRFLTRTNMKVGRLHTKGAYEADTGINKNIMFEAVMLQMTWPGAPTVYYGDEAGLTGWTDPDNRRTYPWGKEDKMMLEFHREMIRVHKKYSAIKTGSVRIVYSNYGILAYARWDEKDTLFVVLNNNKTPKNINIPIWKLGFTNEGFKTVIAAGRETFSTVGGEIYAQKGFLKVPMDSYSGIVLAAK